MEGREGRLQGRDNSGRKASSEKRPTNAQPNTHSSL